MRFWNVFMEWAQFGWALYFDKAIVSDNFAKWFVGFV
jgi:hypothetical protein